MLLDKSIALITGGVRGFGKAFAKELLERGSNVVVADINPDLGVQFEQDCLEKYGKKRLVFVKCDVTNQAELKDALTLTQNTFGGLHIVCNNAGIMTTDVNKSRLQIGINLTAVIEGTFEGIQMMEKKNGGKGGVIVNIASAAGINLMKGAPVYTASKFGVVAFTRSFKHLRYFEEDNIRVNCICPFFADTDMLRQGMAENPSLKNIFGNLGTVKITDVVKAFMQCIEDETLNGCALSITPPDQITLLSFPPPHPKL